MNGGDKTGDGAGSIGSDAEIISRIGGECIVDDEHAGVGARNSAAVGNVGKGAQIETIENIAEATAALSGAG